ncbi:hypothetical protein [Embleya sp. NPDC050493]|uniref:hypothetical protein n=1 Tax=Embleya sp. NPDC050493 TaxID=3363989 RepID=UPI0037991580
MMNPVTNHPLDQLLRESGYSNGALARQVNAALKGTTSYDKSTVYRWLRGSCPAPDVLHALAGVFGHRLGRPVAEADLGFGPRVAVLETTLTLPTSVGATVEAATGLWRLLVHRRDLLLGGATTAAASPTAVFGWHFTPDDRTTERAGASTRVSADIEALHLARTRFTQQDCEQGGGMTHPWLSAYLDRHLAPLLNGSYTDPVGRELFPAAAQLTELCGHMLYDAGAHGAAQRQFILALRMAKAARDRAFAAHVISSLATQAVFQRRGHDAVQLARAGVTAAGNHAPPASLARLYGVEARGHALTLDEPEARRALADADNHLEHIGGDDSARFASYTPTHHAGTVMHTLRDLGHAREAARHLDDVLRPTPGRLRAGALHRVLAASVLLRLREDEHACRLAAHVIAGSRVDSSRLRARLTEFNTEAARTHTPATRDYLEALRA